MDRRPEQDQGTTCSTTAGVLSCDLGAVNAGARKSVHISSPTTAASCGTVDNAASVTTSNDGSDTANDSLEVLCGDIELTKTADADSVNAGDAIGFTLKAENVGDAEARNVKVTDALPAKPGLTWSVSPAVQGCTIAGGALTCDLGTIAAGASRSVHITSPTTAESCGRVDNTGLGHDLERRLGRGERRHRSSTARRSTSTSPARPPSTTATR